MKWQRCVSVVAALTLAVTASAACADVFNMGSGLTSLDFVTVGNPGNPDESGYGGVDYVYQIGKYEVTAGQYTAFLNDAAATDSYGLYNTAMSSNTYGCKIDRSGSSGSYTYSVAADRANRPVNYVSWGDAARFTNWLHNGQGNVSTETGAYPLNGATSRDDLLAVTRTADAKYWIPTENEWYKAAYYDPDPDRWDGPGYWFYPTGSDSTPSNDLITPDPGNNANFSNTIGAPYWRTEVGEFENSASPYGTFDQGGNVRELTESAAHLRGGSYGDGWYDLRRINYYTAGPAHEDRYGGFRVASVPEPGSLTLMLFGALAGLYWWRRRK